MSGYSLQYIADYLGAEIKGDPACEIFNIAPLQNAGAGDISFLDNPTYQKYLKDTQASAVILAKDKLPACSVNAVVTHDPYLAYAKISHLFDNTPTISMGIHETVVMGEYCDIDSSVSIGPYCSIGSNVTLKKNVVLGPHCVIGDNTVIDENTELRGNVVIYHNVVIGQRCLLHSGVVLGADGFGIAKDKHSKKWQKVAQLGGVIIGNDVDIGANTTIDRGALGNTVIEDDVKLDNQIQIGHNVKIGAHTAIAGCVGIAGSTQIGEHCLIGGGACITGHIQITDQVVITGMSGVSRSIDQSGVYSSGMDSQPSIKWRKNVVRFRQLDIMARRLSELEKMVKQLNERPHETVNG